MPFDAAKPEDVRIAKTERAMNAAMLSLLQKNSFRKIAVKDICEESLISRATFYTRYTDKYNFLKWWIIYTWPCNIMNKADPYEIKAEKVNCFVNEYKPVIRNLLYDADCWTMDTVFDALSAVIRLTRAKAVNGITDPEYIVHSNFYIGGMLQYILWQVKNGFPQSVSTMNVYLDEIINTFYNLN